MKKFFKVLLFVFLMILCVSCGNNGGGEDTPTEDIAAVAREFLKSVSITYADGDAVSSVTKDITLVGVTADGVTVTWTSDNNAIVINGNVGKVTQSTEDIKVKVTAKLTYKGTELSKPFTITVKASGPVIVPVENIAVTGEAELEVGDEVTFTAAVTPETATDKSVTWYSSNANVATVDAATGAVVAVGVGTCTISATSVQNADVVGSLDITVTEAIELSTIYAAQELEEGATAKVRGSVVAMYKQGYMLYDETGFMVYYVGKDANLDYKIGDYLEVVGALDEYNGAKQFTNTAKVEKLGDNHVYEFTAAKYDQSEFTEFLTYVQFGKAVNFKVTVTSVSDSYINASISDWEGVGLAVTYPMDKTLYEVGKVYEVTGLALYAKTYNNVNSLYVMATAAGEVHKITFETGVETLTVDAIEFSDYTKVTLPEVYREGYYFMGWNEGETPVEQLAENKDYTLTASWVERVFETIEFETNGGEIQFNNQLVVRNFNNTKGVLKKYDSFTLYKKGSSTKAWASAYYHNLFLQEIEAGTNIYKVTFKAGSGTDIDGFLDGVEHPFDYILSSNATNPENDILKNLYGEEHIYDYYFYFEVPADVKDICNIKVTWNLERIKVSQKVFKFEIDEELPDLTKSYYDFVGWYDNAELTGEPISFHVQGITKYYAKFEATTYEIKYEMNESTTTAELPQVYTIESEEIVLPTAEQMAKDDSTFLGWFDNNDAAGTAITSIPKGSYGEKTLYACWAEKAVRDLEVTADDVAVLNTITPSIIVGPITKIGSYKLVGTGLAAKYADAIYPAGTVYGSLDMAIASAKEGDIIYVMGGTYAAATTISVNNVTIIGPNYNKSATGERVVEAELTALVTVAANGVTLNGLKMTADAAIFVNGDDFKVEYCYIAANPTKMGQNNRLGVIAGEDTSAVTHKNITIENNYIKPLGATAGHKTQIFSFYKVENLYVKNNYFENEASAQGTANTEMAMLYYPIGAIEIVSNEFHIYSDYCIIRTGFTDCEITTMKINDNKFMSNSENGNCGMMFFANVDQGQNIEMIGNEFNYTTTEAIRLQNFAGNFTCKYNAFLGKEFAINTANGSDWVDPATATYAIEKNYFKNGVGADFTTLVKDSYDTQEALAAAYAEYKGTEVQVINYTISYVLNTGSTTAELVTTYNIDSEDITLPAAETMSVKDGTFLGWYDNALFLGEPVTVIAKGSTGNKTFYAKWDIANVTVIELPTSYEAILAKFGSFDMFVYAGASEALYEINNVRYELNKEIFASLNDAIKAMKADKDYTVFVFGGEYTLTADASTELMPKGSNAVTIVGPNALIAGNGERLTEAKISVDAQVSIYGKFTMDGLQVVGLGATKKTSNGNNYFYIKNTLNTEITFNNCVMSDYRTAIYYVKPDSGTASAKLTVTNCAISNIGQFFIWGDKNSTLTELLFANNYVNTATFGAETNSAGSLLRIRSACTTTIVDNVFDGDVLDTTGGIFENSTQNGTAMNVMFNTFKGVTKKLVYAQSTGFQSIVFNKNLYLDASGTAAETTPEYVTGKLVTADVAVCTTEEARAAAYATYLAKGFEFYITYELNDGTTTGTLVNSYYKNDEVALPATETMSKEGYTFVDWFDNADGTGTALTAVPTTAGGNITIYAVWMNNTPQEITLVAEDIATLATLAKCPDIIVDPKATMANYTLVGTGIEALSTIAGYDTVKYVYAKNVFNTLTAAIAAAKAGDVIYVKAGVYEGDLQINTANLTIVGPNALVAGAGTRNTEAHVKGYVYVNADGITLDGLKFTDGAIKIFANYFTLENSYVFGVASTCGANNRLGVITVDNTSNSIIIDNNYIDVNTTSGGRKNQWLTINNVNNIKLTNNTIKNSIATSGSDECSMWYVATGTILIENNIFDLPYGSTNAIIGYNSTSVVANVNVIDNTFNGLGIYFRKLANNSVVNIEGNTFNSTTDNTINIRFTMNSECTNTANVKYNKFNTSNGVLMTETAGTGTLVVNGANNVYSAINATTGNLITAEMSTLAAEDYDAAYATYKAAKKNNIYYVLNGGSAEVELTKEFTEESDDIVLPALTRARYNFLGWIDVFTGEYVTKIAKGTKEDVTVKAMFEAIESVEIPANAAAYAITKVVMPTATKSVLIGSAAQISAKTDKLFVFGETLFTDLASAIAASTDNDVIYLFAGDYAPTAAYTVSKKVAIIGPNAGIKGDAERVAEASFNYTIDDNYGLFIVDGALTLDGIYFTGKRTLSSFGNNGSNLTINNCIIYNFTNVLRLENASAANDIEVVYTNSLFDKIWQFFIWSKAQEKLVKFDFISNTVTATSWGSSASNSVIRIDTAKAGCKVNILNNVFLGAQTIKTGAGTIGINTTNASALVTANKFVASKAEDLQNYFRPTTINTKVTDNEFVVKTDVLTELPTITLGTDCTITGAVDEEGRVAAYNAYLKSLQIAALDKVIATKQYKTAAEVAAAYLEDFNAAATTTCTITQLDTNYIDSAKITTALSNEAMNAKWGWLYTAINAATNNPEMAIATADVSASAVKGYYFANLYGFLNQESHKDTWLGTQSADWSDELLVKTVLAAGPEPTI